MNIKNNNDWEILTPSGWKHFNGVRKFSSPIITKITFTDGTTLNGTPTHKIKLLSGNFISLIELKSGDILIEEKTVYSVDTNSIDTDVISILGVEGEEYISDDITHHNCAFIKNAEEIWVAALPTLSSGGSAVLISTPNGTGGFFHKTYTNAITGQAEYKASTEGGENFTFNPIKLDWSVHPDRDQAWRDRMGAIQGERMARQEFDAEFIGSGHTVIDSDLIEHYASMVEKTPPMWKEGFDGNLWVWERPDPFYKTKYVVVADVARGDGSDFSACHVLDIEKCAQVAEYKGKLGTTEYAHFLISLATQYNDALLVVERENVGWAVLQTIIDRGYKNLFYMSKDRKVVEVERNITNRHNAEERKMVPGFGTTITTRPIIIDKLDTYMRDVENGAITIRSIRLIEELRVFIYNEQGKAVAQEGYNDDLVMSLAIGLWIRDTALRLQQEGMHITRNALDNIRRGGGYEEGIIRPTHLTYDPYKMPTGNPDDPHEDLRWLF